MKNETVTVELKNGTTAFGTISDVDGNMNIHLKLVKLKSKGKTAVALENFSVRGNNIRHIVLPDYLPIDILLEDDGPRRAHNKKEEDPKKKKIKKEKKKRGGDEY